ncbi:retrovirus-related pol polyprotein from transposon TNT 1-94, partial [Tanacetum coccineum]
VSISHQASSVRTPQQNRVVERRNRTLVEAARTMLIFSCASLFLWAKAIATACYTQNRSIIHPRFDNTPYELINNRIPDISFLHVFGALCYPKNDREDIGKLGAKAMVFKQNNLKPGLQSMTSGQISLGLGLTYAPSTITTQQPTDPPQVLQIPTASTTIADTALTPTTSSTQATNIPNTSPDVDELETPKTVADNVPNAMFDGNTFVNPFVTPLMCSKALNL